MSQYVLYSKTISDQYAEVRYLFKLLLQNVYASKLPVKARQVWLNRINAAMNKGTAEAQIEALQNIGKDWGGR